MKNRMLRLLGADWLPARLAALGFVAVSGAGCGAEPSKRTAGAVSETAVPSNSDTSLLPIDRSAATDALLEPSAEELRLWREKLPQPASKPGCAHAYYPSTAWQEVPCDHGTRVFGSPPARPDIRLESVGGGHNDHSAQVSGLLRGVVGTFPKVVGATSETDSSDGQNDHFSLQLNSNRFNNSLCSGSSNPSNCYGAQQFVYVNQPFSTSPATGSSYAIIQYWLVDFGPDSGHPCPGGWNSAGADCYKNSDRNYSDTLVTIKDLATARVSASTDGSYDHFGVSIGRVTVSLIAHAGVLDLAHGWNAAEFNIVGLGNSSQARISAPTNLTVQMTLDNATSAAPTCAFDSMTGETNNLNLVPGSCCARGGSSPAITFIESNYTNPTPKAGFCLLNDITPIENVMF